MVFVTVCKYRGYRQKKKKKKKMGNKLEVRLSSSKKVCLICLIESPLKMMKNALYFVLKALFVLKVFM